MSNILRKNLCAVGRWIAAPPYAGLPWLILAYVVTACLIYSQNGPFAGQMIGFDDQTRMTQALNLVNGGGWYDRTIMRVDPPEGFTTIWARIVDIPIALVIMAAQLVTDQHSAALAATVILPLAELMLLFYVARYAARPLLGKRNAWLVVLFVMFTSALNRQNFTFAGFHPGEASHHAWYIILNALMTGAVVRLTLGLRGLSADFFIMLAVALFLAVGIEGFPLIAGAAATLGLIAWAYGRADLALRSARAMAGGALGGLILLPVDQPIDQFFVVSFIQPSILGPLLVGAAALFLAAEYCILAFRAWPKFLSLAAMMLGAAILGALLLWAFPQILDGPTAALSPNERLLAANEHPEVWSMYRALDNIVVYLSLIAPSLIALGAGMVAALQAGNRRRGRLQAGYLGLTLVSFTLAQLFWRYIHHAMISACFGLSWLWQRIRQGLRKNTSYALVSLLAFVALGPLGMFLIPALDGDLPILSQVAFFPARMYAMQTPYNSCDPVPISRYLNAHYAPATILSVPDWDSAAFLFQTDLVIDFLANFPSHDRFLDAKEFFMTTDEAAARRLALKHPIDLVAVCVLLPFGPDAMMSRPYRQPMLIERLKEGNPPTWLHEVNTGVRSNYRLYAVDKTALHHSESP